MILSDKIKVLRIVEQPAKNDRSPYSSYVLEVEYGTGVRGMVYLRRDKYEAFLLERQILKSGVSFKLLEEYGEIIRDIAIFDETLNNEE